MAQSNDHVLEALRVLTNEVRDIKAEMIALTIYTAAIPGARETPLQAIRNSLTREIGKNVALEAAAHRVLDDLDRLSGGFAELRRTSR